MNQQIQKLKQASTLLGKVEKLDQEINLIREFSSKIEEESDNITLSIKLPEVKKPETETDPESPDAMIRAMFERIQGGVKKQKADQAEFKQIITDLQAMEVLGILLGIKERQKDKLMKEIEESIK